MDRKQLNEEQTRAMLGKVMVSEVARAVVLQHRRPTFKGWLLLGTYHKPVRFQFPGL